MWGQHLFTHFQVVTPAGKIGIVIVDDALPRGEYFGMETGSQSGAREAFSRLVYCTSNADATPIAAVLEPPRVAGVTALLQQQ